MAFMPTQNERELHSLDSVETARGKTWTMRKDGKYKDVSGSLNQHARPGVYGRGVANTTRDTPYRIGQLPFLRLRSIASCNGNSRRILQRSCLVSRLQQHHFTAF
jgi:hypothetical protein